VGRLTIDHRAAKRFEPNPLVDETGRTILGIVGDWAQVDDRGRTELFIEPDLGRVAKASAIGGLLGGLTGGSNDAPSLLRNQGEGRQTVKRARVPMRGVPFRWTAVATLSRIRNTGALDEYLVDIAEADIPSVSFRHAATEAELTGVSNGFADPRWGVYDLVHPDGRRIVRHWATIDDKLALAASTFDVDDGSFPLGLAAMLCLARYHAWRF
jgi:hypothetical protein